jgi:hypothetical protein
MIDVLPYAHWQFNTNQPIPKKKKSMLKIHAPVKQQGDEV